MEKKEYHKSYKATNRHHIIGQSQKELFNVFDDRNVIRMDMGQHDCLHGLFKRLLTPKEQIKFMGDLCSPVLGYKAKHLLQELLSLEDKDFYAEGLVRRK